mmetsp:Transcript_46510/g.108115  ORF Transcript_46510/g.108115 Transcript_46510/m.108115 type:complete len:204 (-) Transcript_46510:662-1273(-)
MDERGGVMVKEEATPAPRARLAGGRGRGAAVSRAASASASGRGGASNASCVPGVGSTGNDAEAEAWKCRGSVMEAEADAAVGLLSSAPSRDLASRSRSPALILEAIRAVERSVGRPPCPGRSRHPRHHSKPPYEGGAPPSKAKRSLRRMSRSRAACSRAAAVKCRLASSASATDAPASAWRCGLRRAACHAGIALPHAMRTLL